MKKALVTALALASLLGVGIGVASAAGEEVQMKILICEVSIRNNAVQVPCAYLIRGDDATADPDLQRESRRSGSVSL